MTYSIKLLAFALLAAMPAWWLTRVLFRQSLGAEDFNRAWFLILSITATSFLSMSGGVFITLIFVLMLFTALSGHKLAPSLVSSYTMVWIVAPPVSYALSNIGGISQFFDLTAPRVACIVLLPLAAHRISTKPKAPTWLKILDILTLLLVVLKLIQSSQESSLLHSVRQSVVSLIDVALPYYVITRSFANTNEVKRYVAWTAVGFTFVACIGVVEFAVQKAIYAELQGIFGQLWQLTVRLLRGNYLRVQATTPQPIILGMLLVFGGAMIWMQWPDRSRRSAIWLTLLVFLGALFATFARGPLLGALIFAASWWLLNRLTTTQFRLIALCTVAALIGVRWMGLDSAVIAYVSQLLGGGAQGEQTAEYRQELLDTGLALISQSPWWGVPDFGAHMQNLRQGEGIIDLVNTYIAVTLDLGLVGLALYIGPIILVAHQLLNHLESPDLKADPEARVFLSSFIALICAFLAIIFTTSVFGIASFLMLLLVAVPAAWLRAHAQSTATDHGVAPHLTGRRSFR